MIEADLVAQQAEYERLAALNNLKMQKTASAKFVFT